MMVLVPIPPDSLEASQHVWLPSLQAIAARSKNDINEMMRMLMAGEAQAFVVWEPEKQESRAFLGVRFVMRGQERVGELIWLTGEDRKSWLHLFSELETYLREHQGCKSIKAIARQGWSKVLKVNGYRMTHVVMEKELP